MQQIAQAQELALENPYFSDQQRPLEPLPYPVYFVAKDPKWQDLIDNPDVLPAKLLYEQCADASDIWSVQAYLDLRQRGLDVHLVSKPVPGKICVIPYYYLKPKDLLFRSYVVGCWHDSATPKLCNQRIVINPTRVLDQTHHFLPHRPQPGLKPRNQSRGATLRNLVFKGYSRNLFASFKTPEFIEELHTLGIDLVTSRDGDDVKFADWCNYTEADAVLAVRNCTHYDINLKPALKLVNAWFAGCPAIVGPESAYQALRKSALDYIEVRTPEEAIAALRYLRNNPAVYVAMIENGFQRAHEFTVDRIMLQWRNLLAGPIASGYEQWCRQSPIEKYGVRPIQQVRNIFSHRHAYQEYIHKVHHGTRVLSDYPGEHQLILPTQKDAEQLGLSHHRLF